MKEQPTPYIENVMSIFGLRKQKAEPNQRITKARTRSVAPDSSAAKAPDTSATPQQKDREKFDDDLKSFVANRDTRDGLVTGRVQMINIDTVRQRMGERWPKIEDRVHSIIKSEIKARLTPHDMFTQANANSYVIVFGNCPEAEAKLKVAMLSELILEKIFGEDAGADVSLLGVQTIATRADGSVDAEAIDSVDSLMTFLDGAAQKSAEPAHCAPASAELDSRDMSIEFAEIAEGEPAGVAGSVAADARPRPPAFASGWMEQLERLEKRFAVEQPSAAPRSEAAPDRDLTQERDRLTQQLALLEKQIAIEHPAMLSKEHAVGKSELTIKRDHLAEHLVRLEKEIAAQHPAVAPTRATAHDRHHPQPARQGPQTAPSGPAGSSPDPVDLSGADIEWQLDVAYLPMWHAPTQKVGIYMCDTSLSLSVDGVRQPPEFAAGATDIVSVADRLTLRSAHKDLQHTIATGKQNVVAVPVHFSTLQNNLTLQRLVDACRYIPESLRRLLIWEIRATHVENWAHQLPSLINAIKPFGRAVFLRLENFQATAGEIQRNLRDVRLSGVHAVGIDVAALKGAEAEKLNLLEGLAKAADNQDLKCYGHGFDSLSMTICAVCMGYHHVSGEAISGPIEKPEGIHTTEMEKVYGRALFDVA